MVPQNPAENALEPAHKGARRGDLPVAFPKEAAGDLFLVTRYSSDQGEIQLRARSGNETALSSEARGVLRDLRDYGVDSDRREGQQERPEDGEHPRGDAAKVEVSFDVLGECLSVAALACWIPARRASLIEPMAALPHD